MRVAPFLFLLLSCPAVAADFTPSADVTAVTLYPRGAAVLREATLDLPPGRHRVTLDDLPRSVPLDRVRVEVEGATLGAVTGRRDALPPRDEAERADIAAARDRLTEAEAALRRARLGVRTIRLGAEAARARLGFLDRLGTGQSVAGMDVPALRALSDMIGEEALEALQQAQAAEARADAAARDLADLERARDRARQALEALLTETPARAALALDLEARSETTARIRVTYVTDAASWTPVYDLRLTRRTGALDMRRGAFVAQSTGEDWRDVALSLSTARPSDQIAPTPIAPRGLRIVEEGDLPRPLMMERAADQVVTGAAPGKSAADTADVVEAAPRFDGLTVTYAYPEAVTIASGADRARLSLGEVALTAELRARAVPLHDETAFLVAAFTNDSAEPILPTREASLYLDGRYVGQHGLDLVPAGAGADLSFGPIEGLRVARRVVERTGGDRGVISRSNDLRETLRLEVENLTPDAWPVEVVDRVPYSEQEDLTIDWRATPAPDEQNVDDQRGLLAWRFDLAPGETQEIGLSTTITWPEGWVLR